MHIAGIIAEYNPFHNGHAWQIAEAKRRGAQKVVVALSAGLVQRGALPLLPENVRVRAALAAGADMVVAIPAPYAMSGAEAFARAGVALLAAAGCDALVFGAESADAKDCMAAAQALLSPEYAAALQTQLKGGARSFAAARQAALGEVCPAAQILVQSPNDNLGVEYCKAILALGLDGIVMPLALPRQGAGHHAALPENEGAQPAAPACSSAPCYASASALRLLWAQYGAAALAPYVPAAALPLYKQAEKAGRDTAESAFSPALLSRLRMLCGSAAARPLSRGETDEPPMPGELPFAGVRGAAGGLDRALEKAVREAGSAAQLFDALTTVRYPRARMRRLALDAALGYTAALPALPPYVHVLGARRPVAFALHGAADAAACEKMGIAALPMDTSLARLARRGAPQAAAAQAQAAAADMGALCRRTPEPMGQAYRQSCVFYTEKTTGI